MEIQSRWPILYHSCQEFLEFFNGLLVEKTISGLSSCARQLMKLHPPPHSFFEANDANTILKRGDLAIAQMLEMNVLQCVDVTDVTHKLGVEYKWTYLGKKCCHRLGIVDNATPISVTGIKSEQMFEVNSYLDNFVPKEEVSPIKEEELGTKETKGNQ